ncbi:MAG TPA: LysR family transcriptional regulator [Planctomycetota bacterium]|nr:LysR family transcriptional regulator [Planctomycetota bacterium]
MMTWVISGAGRGVGKTHLARRLCEILPRAIYAKCGHGDAKTDGPGNFFRTQDELDAFLASRRGSCEHAVVESNAMARAGTGDVIVFLDARADTTNVRDDAAELRDRAHLRVSPGVSIREWKHVLRERLTDLRLRETVCDLLAEQKRFIAGASPAVRTKVWFTVGDMHAFGSGLARLLESIERSGTLSAAAEDARMSYRHAWKLLKNAEKHLGEQLILPQAGGAHGGRTTLTDNGRRLLDVFQRLNREVASFADERFAQLYRGESTDHEQPRHDPA